MTKVCLTFFQAGFTMWLLAGGNGLAHGDLHERIIVVSKQIEERPLDAQLYLRRADMERQHEDWPAALRDYDKARQLDPAMNLDLQRGRTLLEAGRPEGALPLLDRVLESTPDDPQALLFRARALSRLDRPVEAARDFRAAFARNPEPKPAQAIETADSLVVLGLEQDALQLLSAGIAKLGNHPALVLRSMDLAIATRDFDTALVQVEIMRQGAPRPEPWMARRASILEQAGRIDESRAAWQGLVGLLTALPNLERGSPANRQLMEDARKSLATLDRLSVKKIISPTK